MSLSWELGDLVWTSDQTSIDSRSKMMVELREDILDQVTRIYYERKRIQMELMGFSSINQQPQWEKELRIDELTAQLDALTGGLFTESLDRRNHEGKKFQ